MPCLLAVSMVGTVADSAGGMEEYRAIDGSGNSYLKPDRGAAGTYLMRLAGHAYADLMSEPSGPDRPSAREISNEVAQQTKLALNHARGTDYMWLWGQFLDHDIDLSPEMGPKEPFPIKVPVGDPHFDPARTGTQVIGLNRSIYDTGTGQTRNNPRRQTNMITAWIDASNVYGSSRSRADALRRHNGDGLLKTSAGDLFPFNTAGLDNAGGPGPALFLAGDVRANEQVGLTALPRWCCPVSCWHPTSPCAPKGGRFAAACPRGEGSWAHGMAIPAEYYLDEKHYLNAGPEVGTTRSASPSRDAPTAVGACLTTTGRIYGVDFRNTPS